MNLLHAAKHIPLSHQRHPEADTRLHGRWLIGVKVVWGAWAMLTVGLYVAILPAYLTQLQTICTENGCASVQPTPASALAFQHLGISVGDYAAFTFLLTIASTVVCFIVSGVIFWRKSDDWMALLVALMEVTTGTIYVTYTLQQSHGAWRVLALLLNILSNAMLFLIFSLFPDGRFIPGWTRWLVVVWITWSVLFILLRDVAFASLFDNVVWLAELICAIIALIYRYRYVSRPMQRQQTKWVVLGVSATFAVAIGLTASRLIIPSFSQSGSIYELVSAPIYVVDVLFFSLSFGFAILRYHLYNIDIIINRTLVYGALTTLLALIYFALVIGLQYLLRDLINQTTNVAIVIATLVIAALFQPLRSRIQRIIDHRFYRNKYDAAVTLAAYSATLRSEVDLNQLSEQLIAVVQETMQPAHVSLWLRPVQRDEERTAWGAHALFFRQTEEQAGE